MVCIWSTRYSEKIKKRSAARTLGNAYLGIPNLQTNGLPNHQPVLGRQWGYICVLTLPLRSRQGSVFAGRLFPSLPVESCWMSSGCAASYRKYFDCRCSLRMIVHRYYFHRPLRLHGAWYRCTLYTVGQKRLLCFLLHRSSVCRDPRNVHRVAYSTATDDPVAGVSVTLPVTRAKWDEVLFGLETLGIQRHIVLDEGPRCGLCQITFWPPAMICSNVGLYQTLDIFQCPKVKT